MADYTKTTNFTAKDALSSGDPNKVARGTEVDTEFDAIATAIATKMDKTTDNTVTAAHTFSGNVKFTGTPVFNATANVITASGTDTYTGSVGWTAYASGQQLAVKFTNANTGAATLNIDSLGAKSIVNYDGTALNGGEIPASGRVGLVYDGTNFVIQYISALSVTGNVEVRQTALSGSVDSNGQANFISAGTGLACDLAATTTPVVAAMAAGYNASGQVDYITRITADVSSFVSSLEARNRSYIYIDRDTSTGSITYGKTLIPPQYGYTFDRTKQSLLRFPGNDASTTILDDYGNTWTAVADAQVDTGITIDGENTLLLDGTGDYVSSTSFTTLGDGAWQMEVKVRWNTLPTVGTSHGIIEAANGSAAGLNLYLYNNAGTTKLGVYLSSDGSTNDIANAVAGTSTTWSTATTYHITIGYDPVAGNYYVYKDGVVDITVASTAKICAITHVYLGICGGGATYLNGAMAGFRFSPCCRYPNGTTFTVPDVSTFAVEGDYFDIPSMKMYTVTGASSSGGTNPTMTQKHRVYMGEAVTDGTSVTSAITYALKGRYSSPVFTLAATTAYNKSCYIGANPDLYQLRGYTRQSGSYYWQHAVLDSDGVSLRGAGYGVIDRNTIRLRTTTYVSNNDAAEFASFASGNSTAGQAILHASRGW